MECGHRSLSQLAQRRLELRLHRLAPRSYITYRSHLRKFFAFCHQYSINPQRLTSVHKEEFIAYLTLNGGNGATAPQYLSGINTIFRSADLPLPFPPQHPSRQLLKGARRLQPPGHKHRQALPPSTVQSILTLGLTSDDPSTIQAAASIIFCIIFGFRGHTYAAIQQRHVRLTTATIDVDVDDEKHWYMRDTRAKKRTVTYHATADNQPVFDLFNRFHPLRPANQPTRSFFSLASDPPRLPATALNATVHRTLAQLHLSAPGYNGHSIRYNFASMCHSINVALIKICFIGGWASDSGAVHRYIEANYPFHPISSLLFNGMLPPPFRHSIPPHLLGL